MVPGRAGARKGLKAKALTGVIKVSHSIDDPYLAAKHANLTIDATGPTVQEPLA